MNGEILYQGHASVRITTKDGKVIYIDPYSGSHYDKPADLILVTHQHFDHTAINKPPHNDNCLIWENYDALKNGQYQKLVLGDIQVQAVEAYNRNHSKNECVGYILYFDGIKVYIAGDTALTNQMSTLKNEDIDYVFLPTDGIFTMNSKDAAKCAEIISAKYAIPYHTDPGSEFNRKKAEKFKAPNRLILSPGDKINY